MEGSITGRIHSFQSLGAVDGPGLRFVVFVQGCPLRCMYCHNPDSWNRNGGTEYTVDEVVAKVLRYRTYFGEDGGVTVSVIQKTDKDAPHSTDTSWGKHFGWYDFENGKPLLVFPLDDCTDMAWYGPEK